MNASNKVRGSAQLLQNANFQYMSLYFAAYSNFTCWFILTVELLCDLLTAAERGQWMAISLLSMCYVITLWTLSVKRPIFIFGFLQKSKTVNIISGCWLNHSSPWRAKNEWYCWGITFINQTSDSNGEVISNEWWYQNVISIMAFMDSSGNTNRVISSEQIFCWTPLEIGLYFNRCISRLSIAIVLREQMYLDRLGLDIN